MFDTPIRNKVVPLVERLAEGLASRGINANQLTFFGFAVGVGACVSVALGQWWLGLALWIANRVIDGFDGAVARIVGPTEFGGFLDIMADFAIYAGIVVAIGISEPSARVAALVTLLAYYLNGSSFLAFSSLAERLNLGGSDGRSLIFPTGLAEGSETILAIIIVLVFRAHAATILWVWVVIVFVTVGQRMLFVRRRLRHDRPDPEAKESAR